MREHLEARVVCCNRSICSGDAELLVEASKSGYLLATCRVIPNRSRVFVALLTNRCLPRRDRRSGHHETAVGSAKGPPHSGSGVGPRNSPNPVVVDSSCIGWIRSDRMIGCRM